jgi:ribosome-associated protein
VRNIASFCDYFVLASGSSRRQVHALAESVQEDLRTEHGLRPFGVEGLEASRWALLDFGDVIVHVFDAPLRGFYDLEGLWSDAHPVEVDLEPAPREAPEALPLPPAP